MVTVFLLFFLYYYVMGAGLTIVLSIALRISFLCELLFAVFRLFKSMIEMSVPCVYGVCSLIVWELDLLLVFMFIGVARAVRIRARAILLFWIFRFRFVVDFDVVEITKYQSVAWAVCVNFVYYINNVWRHRHLSPMITIDLLSSLKTKKLMFSLHVEFWT